MATRTISVEIIGDARSLEKAFGRAENSGSKFGKAMKVGLGGIGAAVAGLGVAAKLGFDEFLDAQKVMAQTEAVLKSTGGAANVTAEQVTGLSEALMRKSGVDDEAIQSGENMLLTFTKIRNEAGRGNDIFNQATKATLDLSVAMGKDMQSSAILVGKALNDPIKGMTALSRAGIQFTEEQKNTVKALVASGDAMGAQKIILKELETQFGGSAEAAGKTFSGQMNIAKQTALNFAGDIVAKVVPALADMVEYIRANWPRIRAIIQDVTEDVRALWKQWGDEIMAVVNFVFPIIKQTIENTLKIIEGVVDIFVGVLTGDWSRAWNGLKDTVGAVLNQITLLIRNILPLLGKAATELGEEIKDGAVAGVKGLPAALWTVITGIGGVIAEGRGTINGWGANVGGWLKQAAVDALVGIGMAAWGIVNNIGSVIDDFAKTIRGWGGDVARYLVNGLLDGLSGLGQSIWEKIKGAFEWVKSKIPSLPKFDVPGIGDAFNPSFVPTTGFTDSGVAGLNLLGARPEMAPFAALGQSLGLVVTSGLRPGAITANGTPSDHGTGKALDMAGSAAAMAEFFRRLIGNPRVKQAFYDPLGSIFGGRLNSYREGGHSDHVHVATYDQGGFLRPGWNLAYNGTGRPEPVGFGRTMNVTVNMPNYLGNERDVARAIRDELRQLDRVETGGSRAVLS